MGEARQGEEKKFVWRDVGDPEDDGMERKIIGVPHWFQAFFQHAFRRRPFLREELVNSGSVVERPAIYCSCVTEGPGQDSQSFWSSVSSMKLRSHTLWLPRGAADTLDCTPHRYKLKPPLSSGDRLDRGRGRKEAK